MNDQLNQSLIRSHEGLMLTVYKDTMGNRTIGVGFNLDAAGAKAICGQLGIDYASICLGKPITMDQANALFQYTYGFVLNDLVSIFPGFKDMPDNVCAVLCDMRFELGFGGFRQFHLFIAAIKNADWAGAIAQMKHSLWESQVPGRVANDISLMESV